MLDAHGQLRAVLTVDFDINVLSSFIHQTTLPGARSTVITQDGAVLVYTDGTQRVVPPATERLLRIEDTGDPWLIRGWAERLSPAMAHPQQRTVHGPEGEAWLRVTPIAGVRAGIATPLHWQVVTVVPTRALLAPARSVVQRTIVVALLALGGALGLAMLLAANLVGLRKRVQLATSQVQLMGSYRLLEKIGVGGMGEVWRAQHELLARDAAVKLLRYAGSDAPAVRAKVEARFRREAQVVAQMRSRHTIELYDYGVAADGTLYFAMELLDGLDFDTLVRRFGPQPWPRVCHFLQQACASLAEAHDHGLFHRDIKPANLFACRAADEVDIVKVLDFGIVHVG